MRAAFIGAAIFVALQSQPVLAWGSHAHRYIMGRAIDALPAAIKPFFEHFRTELVVRSIDPDTWRTAGWADDSSHFLDFGAPEYGPRPFVVLPREYGAAIEKFGMATLKKYGVLPWREAEEFGNLRRAMEGFNRSVPFAPGNTILFAAVMSHYIQDAHMPLHASNNHDGQLTGQNGVHGRFESELFERYQSQLTIAPRPPSAVSSARDKAFDVLLESFKLVQPLLDADREAIAGKDIYDDEYYRKFFEKARPILERRIGESITATASLIVSAWEAAGKPALKVSVQTPPQKVRTPR